MQSENNNIIVLSSPLALYAGPDLQPQSNLTDSNISQSVHPEQFKSKWRASSSSTPAFENISIVQHLLTKSERTNKKK